MVPATSAPKVYLNLQKTKNYMTLENDYCLLLTWSLAELDIELQMGSRQRKEPFQNVLHESEWRSFL